jgi:iron(III) transport system substrate-binding protein
MWTVYGRDGAERMFQGLKQNGIRVVNGNSTAVRMIAQGQGEVCLTDTDDVWVAQRNGWPVEIVYPNHGRTGTLVFPNTVALVRGSPHPTQAGKLIDFLLSEEVEEILVKSDSHNIPVRETLALKYPKYKVPAPMPIDYEKISGVMDDAVRSAVKVLGN